MSFLTEMPRKKYAICLCIYILLCKISVELRNDFMLSIVSIAMFYVEYRRIVDAGKSKICMLTIFAPVLNWFYMLYLCFPLSKSR